MNVKRIYKNELPTNVSEIIKERQIDCFSIGNLDKNISGFTSGNIIGINENKDIYEKRFSLCHELGHNVLGHKFGDNREEKEADKFALNLLVDEKDLREKIEVYGRDLSQLQSYFGVPYKELEKLCKVLYKDYFPGN